MLDRLITLADKLDGLGHIKAASFVDNLIKIATDIAPADEWDEITKVEKFPIKSLPPLDPSVLEQEPVMRGMDIISKLRAIFKSLPNPDQWNDNVKFNVIKLLDRLREIL